MRSWAGIPFLTVLCLGALSGKAWQQDGFEISGLVRDPAGHAIAEATVQLQAQGGGSAVKKKTDSAGTFVFPGLADGSYVVSASSGPERSDAVSVQGARGTAKHIELTLQTSSNRTDDGNKQKSAGIEFSDLPNFTVAGVTDWTAAGGHGSDASLRASESLTRETLALKPAAKNAANSAMDADTEQRLRKILDSSPRDLKANEDLGRFYLSAGRYPEALAPLETAYELDPTQKDNEFALALALNETGQPTKARAHVDRLLAAGDKAEWHRLAGEIDEKLGDPLGAVQAFELAVKEDPSEDNYFAWGTELLQHRAIWQAKGVFEAAVKSHPSSSRLLTALGTALFSAAMYNESAERLCQASDLSPKDVEPYLFMGKVEIVAPDPLPCVEARLLRFVTLQPTSALANYYYAMAYWKQRGKSINPQVREPVEKFLNNAVEADPKCSSAYLQLGVIQSLQSDFHKAADYYQQALEADPLSTEAYYRLGVAYDHLGEKAKAAEAFRQHEELEKKQAAAVDRQRREVKQFLVLVGDRGEGKSAKP